MRLFKIAQPSLFQDQKVNWWVLILGGAGHQPVARLSQLKAVLVTHHAHTDQTGALSVFQQLWNEQIISLPVSQ